MKEIGVKLWYHRKEKDWTIEVDGVLHEHVSAKTVDDLVEYAMVAAQQALLKELKSRAKPSLPPRLLN